MLKQKDERSKWLNRVKKRLNKEYNKIVKPEIVEIEGIKVRLGDYVSETIRQALYSGYYEHPELQMVKYWLKPDDVVMEVGAGLGLISSYCAKKIGSDRVFTYEANPALEEPIKNNYNINGVSPTLEICLVGDEIGEKIFYIDKSFWASSITHWNADATAVKVPMKCFNQEVKRLNPTFLIMDVEGGEYEIIKQADFHNIQKISIEIHEQMIGHEKVESVKAKLASSGFKVNKEFSNKHKNGLEELFLQR